MSASRRVDELLAERATQALTIAQTVELEGLLKAEPDVDADAFDRAAAAVDLALTRKILPMPESVRRSVGERIAAELRGAPAPRPSLAPVVDLAAERTLRRPAVDEKKTASGRLPWLAAAAALVLAVAGWWPRTPVDGGERQATALEAVAAAPDAVRWQWAGTEDATVGEVAGEVVWSSAEQRGFMRIRGLAANDPNREQYQLWIFDRAQDERYPVDGGVFDLTADGEALIPIDAKIAVDEPYLFAITVEPPGGVVVSSRERIALLAQA